MEISQSYDAWNRLATQVALVCAGLAVFIGIIYLIRLTTMSGSKNRYDFISKYEVKTLWAIAVIIYLGVSFFANSMIENLTSLWIFVRIFTTLSMMTIVTLATQNVLNFYYPFFVGKRLKALRYKPRISPKTGNPMKLLSEDEEDAYLDEGMQAEENLFSIDYDVWKDEETGYTKVEKYSGYLHAVECPECQYMTFRVAREEVIKRPDALLGEHGELLKHYECTYCGYKAVVSVNLVDFKEVEVSGEMKDQQDVSSSLSPSPPTTDK